MHCICWLAPNFLVIFALIYSPLSISCARYTRWSLRNVLQSSLLRPTDLFIRVLTRLHQAIICKHISSGVQFKHSRHWWSRFYYRNDFSPLPLFRASADKSLCTLSGKWGKVPPLSYKSNKLWSSRCVQHSMFRWTKHIKNIVILTSLMHARARKFMSNKES